MNPADLMAKAEADAAETHTTVAWLNIAADALAAARGDPGMDDVVLDILTRSENGVLLALAMLKGAL